MFLVYIFSTENIKAGFSATGIYPLNRGKYSVDRLDKIKLNTYEAWVAAGKERDEDNNLILPPTSSSNVSASQMVVVPEVHNTPGPSSSQCAPPQPPSGMSPSLGPSSRTPMGMQSRSPKVPEQPTVMTVRDHIKAAFAIGDNVNQEFANELRARGNEEVSKFIGILVSQTCQEDARVQSCSLEDVLHKRGRPAGPPLKKRKVLSMEAAVITDEQYQKKINEARNPRPKKKGA